MTIDAHQHFWTYDRVKHDWIGEDMAVIRRDFLPEHLAPVLDQHHVDGCIAVQADQTIEETDFLLEMSLQYDFIKGVVGWIDLQSPGAEEILNTYIQFSKLKGFRHILQGEPQRDLCLQQPFLAGISLLERFDLTYDILVLRDQLQYIPEFVSQFPNQRFVLDHLAKPDIKSGDISDWKRDIEMVAQHENVYCKVSGMVTEADLQNWKTEDFAPYLDTVTASFGMDRLMYGSDWPVCLAAGNYTKVLNIVKSYFQTFSEYDQQRFFGGNAIDFYRL